MISRKGGTAGRARAAASGSPRCRTSPRSPPACERQAGRLIASRRRRRGATGRSRSPIPTASRSRSSRSRAADAALRYRGHAGAADVRGRLIAVPRPPAAGSQPGRSEEHTSELQSRPHLVCRLLLEKKRNFSFDLLRGNEDSLEVTFIRVEKEMKQT